MASWMKIKYSLVISVLISTSIWAEPNTSQTIHPLDDKELSNITDHNHSSMETTDHVNHHSKDIQLTKEDGKQQRTFDKLITQEPKPQQLLPPNNILHHLGAPP